MAQVTNNFDVKIRIVHPLLTKPLPSTDRNRIQATGSFTFEPPPQVDVGQGPVSSLDLRQDEALEDKIQSVRNGLEKAIDDIDRLEELLRKRSGHITFRYDAELADNEDIALAEEDIFGFASGAITYDMYMGVLKFEEKINKFISHMSMENEGAFRVSA